MSVAVVPVLLLSLRVAATATALVLVPAAWVGYALARWEFPGKRMLSAVVGLPLVLPPTAVGFVLLRLLAADGPLGRGTLGFDLEILLTWKAAVLASATMSLPLVARTARVTFEGIDPRLEMMHRTLGHGRLGTFLRVTLPLAGRGLSAAAILGFTRALGEFGATVTLASAIFSAQQVGDHPRADLLMVVALAAGLTAILSAELLAGRGPAGRGGS